MVVIDRKVAKKSPQFIVDSAKKCIGDYTLFFELEKRIPISPSLDELRLSDGNCILVEVYVVQFILFYP